MKVSLGDLIPEQNTPSGWKTAPGTRGLNPANTGAYIPPGRNTLGSSWNPPRRRYFDDVPKKEPKEPLTDDDFPTLGGDSSVPLTNSKPNWGAHLAKKKESPKKDKLAVGWRDLTKPPTKEEMANERSGLVFMPRLSKPDDADAEWREKYAQMYPNDTGDYDHRPAFDDEEEEDPQADSYYATEQKYSGRRARKNPYEDEM
jgi:hypothetical protein